MGWLSTLFLLFLFTGSSATECDGTVKYFTAENDHGEQYNFTMCDSTHEMVSVGTEMPTNITFNDDIWFTPCQIAALELKNLTTTNLNKVDGTCNITDTDLLVTMIAEGEHGIASQINKWAFDTWTEYKEKFKIFFRKDIQYLYDTVCSIQYAVVNCYF